MKIHSKSLIKLIAPILAFPILFLPYQLLNSAVIVKWLGCGCPKVDASGEMIHDYFSANDFTRVFWIVVAVGVTVFSWFVSKKVLGKNRARVLYVAGIFVASLFIATWVTGQLLWS
ncbi:MAG: hypothetical protein J6J44_01930 [Lachnospiraceae bacterium]|nr:hypothetical protein [Lachnospiraceae bacterium]